MRTRIVCAVCGRTLKGRPARAGGWRMSDHLTPGREPCPGVDRTDHQSVDGTAPVLASPRSRARRPIPRRADRPSSIPAWLEAHIDARRPGQEPTR